MIQPDAAVARHSRERLHRQHDESESTHSHTTRREICVTRHAASNGASFATPFACVTPCDIVARSMSRRRRERRPSRVVAERRIVVARVAVAVGVPARDDADRGDAARCRVHGDDDV